MVQAAMSWRANGGGAAAAPAPSRGLEAGARERPADRVGVLIVDLSGKTLVPPLCVLLGRRTLLRRPRSEFARARFDRTEDSLVHEVGKLRIADPRKTRGQHDVAEVAVAELSNVLRERLSCREPHQLLWR